MSQTLRDMIPAAHRRLLPVLFDRPAPSESRATCDDCAMCSKTSSPPPGAVFFRPDTKCCTYEPTLPNFLVGAILADESPELAEGRRRIQARIESRIGVTPVWLAPPRKKRVLVDAARGTSFGRSRVLLCAYYDEPSGGRCTIWRHREAVCSTFFCKHEAGQTSDDFWMSEKRLLGKAELVLAKDAAAKVSPDVVEPSWPPLKLTVEDLEDRAPDELEYTSWWGPFEGREQEFYRACHAHVAAQSPDDLERLLEEVGGADMVADATRRYDALSSREIPEHLVPNPEMRITKLPSGVVATTYSIFDSMHLTPDLYEVVHQFAASETVAAVRARLFAEFDLTIPDELLVSLQQHRILVPPR
jgi:hypothetical protein